MQPFPIGRDDLRELIAAKLRDGLPLHTDGVREALIAHLGTHVSMSWREISRNCRRRCATLTSFRICSATFADGNSAFRTNPRPTPTSRPSTGSARSRTCQWRRRACQPSRTSSTSLTASAVRRRSRTYACEATSMLLPLALRAAGTSSCVTSNVPRSCRQRRERCPRPVVLAYTHLVSGTLVRSVSPRQHGRDRTLEGFTSHRRRNADDDALVAVGALTD